VSLDVFACSGRKHKFSFSAFEEINGILAIWVLSFAPHRPVPDTIAIPTNPLLRIILISDDLRER
jgi:hypothetical protein